jgi:hypothetical protein
MTTAAAKREVFRLTVIAVPAPEATGPDQISVVVPDVPVDWVTLDQVTPAWVMLDTWLTEAPRVEITAIIRLPLTGAAGRAVMTIDVAAAAPVEPVVEFTRTAAASACCGEQITVVARVRRRTRAAFILRPVA